MTWGRHHDQPRCGEFQRNPCALGSIGECNA